MTTLLIIVGIAALALLLRPAPRPQVIYVPVEISEERGGGLGCLPVIAAVVLVLLALMAVVGMPT